MLKDIILSLRLFMRILKFRYQMLPGKWNIARNIAYLDGSEEYVESIINKPINILNSKICINLKSGKKNNSPFFIQNTFSIIYLKREKSLKFFDLINHKVYTKFENDVSESLYYKYFFNLSEVLPLVPTRIDAHNRYAIEPLIKGKSLKELDFTRVVSWVTDLSKIAKTLHLKSVEFSPKLSKHHESTDFELWSPYLIEYFTRVKPNSNLLEYFLQNVDFASRETHGDLSESNVIYINERFYVIDLDTRRFGIRPYWYDIIYLINRYLKMGYSHIDFLKSINILFLNDDSGINNFDIINFMDFYDWFCHLAPVKYPKIDLFT